MNDNEWLDQPLPEGGPHWILNRCNDSVSIGWIMPESRYKPDSRYMWQPVRETPPATPWKDTYRLMADEQSWTKNVRGREIIVFTSKSLNSNIHYYSYLIFEGRRLVESNYNHATLISAKKHADIVEAKFATAYNAEENIL